MKTEVKIKVNPDSVTANVVVMLIEDDLITPLRFSREEADNLRRWLLGLEGANHKGPANIDTPSGKLHMNKEAWVPMLVELNKWYDEVTKGN